MTGHSIGRFLSAGILMLAVGCAPSEQEEEGEPDAPATATVAMPETTAASVWDYLQQVDYQNTWQRWPETDALYGGNPPHGMLLTTYANEAAQGAIAGMAGSMPAGAVLVKENYMPDSTLAAVTVMYKVEGYNADHNDWFWLKRNADGTVAAEGQVEGCQNCHGGRADNDYLFTSSIGAGGD